MNTLIPCCLSAVRIRLSEILRFLSRSFFSFFYEKIQSFMNTTIFYPDTSRKIITPNYSFPVNIMKKKKKIKKEPYITSFAIIILNFSGHRPISNPDRPFWRESMTHDREGEYFPRRFLLPLLLAFHIPFFPFLFLLLFFSSPPSTPPPTARGLPPVVRFSLSPQHGIALLLLLLLLLLSLCEWDITTRETGRGT